MIPISPTLVASAASAALGLLGSAGSNASSAQPAARGDQISSANFMQLLIAQLQNQDPLNPLDSANFSAQLAQFSSLQQLVEINQHLTEQTGGSDSGGFDAVGFLGKEVRGASGAVTVADGDTTTLEYELPASGIVKATILDAQGRQAGAVVLGSEQAGAHTLDLKTVSGAPRLADGGYTVQLTVSAGDGTAIPVDTFIRGRVTGVELTSSGPVLLLGERRLSLADVHEVREPEA